VKGSIYPAEYQKRLGREFLIQVPIGSGHDSYDMAAVVHVDKCSIQKHQGISIFMTQTSPGIAIFGKIILPD
jgi:hypothetical protein